MSPHKVIDVFEQVSDQYDEVLPFFSEFAREFTSGLPLAPGNRVLDLGAGRGAVTAHALARGCRVTAIDAAPGMVTRLAAAHPQAATHRMDAHRLQLPDAAFDFVLSSFVIHLLENPRTALREASRVLAPGGRIAFTRPGPPPGFEEPAVDGPEDPLGRIYTEFDQYLPQGGGRMGRPLDEPRLLHEAGFTDITATPLGIALPVPDGETYWRWTQSHGSVTFFADLPAARRAESRNQLIADTDAIAPFTLHRWATAWTAANPS
jgi:ubiquinone/menaquinone biosynthesis C-methylase UbiE